MFIVNKSRFLLLAVFLFSVAAPVLFAAQTQMKYETANFILYFEDSQDDGYKDRARIAEITEQIYEETANRLNIRFGEKIPVYLVSPMFENRTHGYAMVSMNKSGKVFMRYIHFPLNVWRNSRDFRFIKPLLPHIEKYTRDKIEEQIVTALFLFKYLKSQNEPRKFNATIYELARAFRTERDIHSPIRWIIDHAADHGQPMRLLLSTGDREWDPHTSDIVSSKSTSFGGFIIEKYGFEKFEKLLRSADCENVNMLIEKYYGKSTDVLEDEWRRWLRKKITVYDEPPLDLRIQRHNEVSAFYTAGWQLREETLRRRFQDASAVLRAMLSICEYSDDVYQPAKKLATLRLKEAVDKERIAEVDFYFTDSSATADTVSIAGSFNNWNPSAPPYKLKLTDSKKGLWHTKVYLARGRHQYKFLVDDSRWFADESADGLCPDGFGGQNSVLVLSGKNNNRVVKAGN